MSVKTPSLNRFSFSKISCFKQCPMKYKFQYILKIEKEEDNAALIKGSKIHSLLEHIDEFKYNPNEEHHDIVNDFKESPLGKEILNKPCICELTVRFNEDLIGGDWERDNTRLIGFVDRVNVYDNNIELIDYKTGKYKDQMYQDFDQLIIYSLYFFDKYPKIQDIKLRFVYVEHFKENTLTINRDYVETHRNLLKNDINAIESTNEFKKNKGPLCKWCKFQEECLAC